MLDLRADVRHNVLKLVHAAAEQAGNIDGPRGVPGSRAWRYLRRGQPLHRLQLPGSIFLLWSSSPSRHQPKSAHQPPAEESAWWPEMLDASNPAPLAGQGPPKKARWWRGHGGQLPSCQCAREGRETESLRLHHPAVRHLALQVLPHEAAQQSRLHVLQQEEGRHSRRGLPAMARRLLVAHGPPRHCPYLSSLGLQPGSRRPLGEGPLLPRPAE
mmetsp:Transcript_15773/g.35066  ORF Transcript_15773/g.35066 Transcript_15773/m.35066 type:complete len:214 (-) Transcript_15773:300-941(-)